MKYTIIHVNNRATKNIQYNSNILKDFELLEDVVFFNAIENNPYKELEKININYSTWKPYDGRSLDPLPGELGIWLSNINIWNNMINNNIEQLLVLEDDIILNYNFVENLKLFMEDLPKDFDFLSLYYFDEQNNVDSSTDVGSNYIHRSYNQYSAGQGTVYSLSGAKKIINLVKKLGIQYTSDCFMFNHCKEKFLNGYSIKAQNNFLLEHDNKNINSFIDSSDVRQVFYNKNGR
jgi:GR25 family glycosyltransferase involved in LPS biosynthesis